MHPTRILTVTLLVLAGLVAPSVSSAQSIIGTVLADPIGERIPNVNVTLFDADGVAVRTAMSDTAGVFRIRAPGEGRYTLRADHLGYATVVTEPLELGAAEAVRITISMSVDAVPLEPLVVTERRRYPSSRIQEFHERAEEAERTGMGRIVTRGEIERLRPTLRTLMATMPVGYSPLGRCEPRIFLDGLDLGLGADAIEHVDRMTHWEDIEGIEIYRGVVQIPTTYYKGDCAAVLVWTRADATTRFSWRRLSVLGGFLLLVLLL